MTRRIARSLLAALGLFVLALGCGADQFGAVNPGQQAVFNLGEIAFGIWGDTLRNQGASECGAEKAAKLEEWHVKFVDAVNATVPTELTVKLAHNVDSVLPLVDDDTIPKMTDDVRGILKLLRTDTATMNAIVKLQDAKSFVTSNDTIDFVSKLLSYRDFDDILTAVNRLIKENDGVDDQGAPNGEKDLVGTLLQFLSDSLKELDPSAPASSSDKWKALKDALLGEATFSTAPNFGAPAWSVRVDKNGNPKVAVDASTSALFTPFVDADADSVADVNASQEPVDSSGLKIDLAPFSDKSLSDFNTKYATNYSRDASMRLVAPGGAFVFEYYDTKLTALSLLLQMIGDLRRKDVQGSAIRLLPTIMGAKTPYNAGTANEYQGYPDDNPLIDLIWTQLELQRWPSSPRLMDTIADALETKTVLVEKIVVSLSKAIRSSRDQYAKSTALSTMTLTDGTAAWTIGEHVGKYLNPDIKQQTSFLIAANDATSLTINTTGGGDLTSVAVVGDRYRVDLSQRAAYDSWKLMEDLLPVLDRLFDTQVTGGTQPASIARLILAKLSQIPRQDLQNLPKQLAVMYRYTNAIAENPSDPSDPDDIDQSKSTPVDFGLGVNRDAQGRLLATGSNASIMQQLMEVTYLADQCTSFLHPNLLGWNIAPAPWPNPTLATDVLEIMATSSPQTVQTLVSILMAVPWLAQISCPALGGNLAPLDALCKSGALNAILPIAAVFKQSNDIRLLADLFVTMHKNYDPAQSSDVLRQGDAGTADFMESGALEHVFDALVEMNGINVPGSTTGEVLNDLVADSIANLVDDDDATMTDRKGQPVKSRALMLVSAMKTLDNRVQGANLDSEMEKMNDAIFDVLLKLDDNGTPTDSSDDTKLKNQTLIPLLAKLLRYTADQIAKDQATRDADIAKAQTDAADFLKGRKFADLIEIWQIMEDSPSKQMLEDALMNLITPNPNQGEDIFGYVMKTLASSLSVTADEQSLKQVGRFLGDVLDPQKRYVTGIVDGVVKILDRDAGKTLLTIIRNAFDKTMFDDPFFAKSPLANSKKAPIQVIMDILDELKNVTCAAKPAGAGKMTLADLQKSLDTTISFMEDDQQGLPFFYRIIKNRAR